MGIINYVIKGIIPIIIGGVVLFGVIKKVKVYECFIEGAKEGMSVCLRIFPYLLAMLIAVNCFKVSGAMNYFIKIVKPSVSLLGIPPEVVPLILIKPLSGSGAVGVFTDLVKTYGPDSYIGFLASIIMGGTETIFYTLTVYYGAIGIKRIRHSLWVALIVDLCAIIIAVNLAVILIK